MAILTKLLESNSVSLNPNLEAIILKKDLFPKDINAGQIDQFIETNFPGVISRIEGQVNGVSVTPTEIVITLDKPINDTKINNIIKAIQDKW